ncbi:hypothetical protein FAM19031_001143 [Propionibacterium freudenreichii]|nr:hypothetical protein [Propionibacterium freudenreichii]MDK9360411.1 hypothetical protein [Propionibacterium freudenreichii]
MFVFEAVAVGGEPVEFVGFGGHEPVEFVVGHPGEGFLLGWGDLDAVVVVLNVKRPEFVGDS